MSRGTGALSNAPTSRTRSIWLWQLVLTAAVAVITAVLLILAPELFADPTTTGGVGLILAVTVVVLVVRWDRVRAPVVALVPIVDICAIGLMAWATELRYGFLWVFPLAWLATHYTARWMIGGLLLVAAIIALDALSHTPNATGTLRFLVVLLPLTFLSITVHSGAMRTRAFNRLLRRQSARLETTLSRVRAQERRIVQMLNALDAGVARIDREGTLVATNDAFLNLYGLERRDLSQPGTSVEYDERGGTAIRESERLRTRAARGEEFEEHRLWLFDAHGQWRTVTASTRELASSPGEATTTLLIVRDITAEVELEAARRTLATTVTHELANPLTAIVGYTDLLLEGDPSPRQREKLELIDAAGRRMERLIADVLRAGGRAQPSEAPRRLIDAREVLLASVESFAPAAAAGDVDLRLSADTAVPLIADAFRLRQVFDNLVSNAVKYTPPAGAVTVDAEPVDEQAVITIRDTGIGIAADDLPRVFTDYFRAETAREAGMPGTGLGMGIARGIVEQHGGTLTLASVPGAGTTVIVRLPLARADELEAAHVTTGTGAAARESRRDRT